jgi:hypothetical protein
VAAPRDVPPVDGMIMGARKQRLDVSVAVKVVGWEGSSAGQLWYVVPFFIAEID